MMSKIASKSISTKELPSSPENLNIMVSISQLRMLSQTEAHSLILKVELVNGGKLNSTKHQLWIESGSSIEEIAAETD